MKANLANEKFYLKLVARGKLKVTRSGRAFNRVTGREIATSSRGYRKLSWLDKATGKIKQIQLHRLVWCVYRGMPATGRLEINHIDGDKSNCCLSNLELVSSKENTEHARKTRLLVDPKGEQRVNAVFKDKQVVQFRLLHASGKMTIPDIAKKVGCHYVTASDMIRRRTYNHV